MAKNLVWQDFVEHCLHAEVYDSVKPLWWVMQDLGWKKSFGKSNFLKSSMAPGSSTFPPFSLCYLSWDENLCSNKVQALNIRLDI